MAKQQQALQGKRPVVREPGNFALLWKHKTLTLMLLPGLVILLLFSYGPIYGLQIAFKDYIISEGIWGSPWVGLKHFENFFHVPGAVAAIRNTVIISLYKLIIGFPAPIILALMINEVRCNAFKRTVQTITYLPHFISWVILGGIIYNLLSPSSGLVSGVCQLFGIENPPILMTSTRWFRSIIVISSIWQEIGWNAVVYLAAISGINAEMYESAIIDGARRTQMMRYITVPTIAPTIATLLILRMSGILNAGFDQIFNLYNASVMPVADIIDTYVYRVGLVGMQYSFNTAIGLFKSLVGLIMVVAVNFIVKRISHDEMSIL